MKAATTSNTNLALATISTLACALSFTFMLDVITSPPNDKLRLAALRAKAGDLERIGRDTGLRTASLVCERSATQEAPELISAVDAESRKLNLRLTGVEAFAEPLEGGAGNMPAPVVLRFTTQGSYEGAVQLLDQLSRSQPTVFVDSIDLRSRTSQVELKFVGRVFCAAAT